MVTCFFYNNKLIIFAWENGIKSLYYQIGSNASQEFSRDLMIKMKGKAPITQKNDIVGCVSCEG